MAYNEKEYKRKWYQEHKKSVWQKRKERMRTDPEFAERCKGYVRRGKAKERERGRERSIKFKLSIGGKCCKCGYCNNLAALEFHHLRDKKFVLSSNAFKSYSDDVILEEAKKCVLLCANCHREEHNPHLSSGSLPI